MFQTVSSTYIYQMTEQAFHFKQFTVNQKRSAMKIGTDGILLGAWTSILHNPVNILDIGAGTGLLSLMLAQRSNAAAIDAIEIDDDAYEECVENFERSPWRDRLFCYHASFLEFVAEIDDQFDLIVSNPPFFDNALKSGDAQRDLARYSDALPFEHLLYGVSKLLSEVGQFSVIIPYPDEKRFIAMAESVSLFPNTILRTKGTVKSDFKRSLMSFSFDKKNTHISELIIERERHVYTEKYQALTSEFYLNM